MIKNPHKAQLAFAGVVQKIDFARNKLSAKVTMDISEPYLGCTAGRFEFNLIGGECDLGFEVNKSYIVLSTVTLKNPLSICTTDILARNSEKGQQVAGLLEPESRKGNFFCLVVDPKTKKNKVTCPGFNGAIFSCGQGEQIVHTAPADLHCGPYD